MVPRWLPMLLVAACSNELLQIPSPAWPVGAKSYVIFLGPADGSEIVVATAKQPSQPALAFGARFERKLPADLAITVAWYSEGLTELELQEGAVEEKTRPCGIERPLAVSRYDNASMPGLSWKTTELSALETERLRSEKCGRLLCRAFQVAPFTLAEVDQQSVTILLRAEDGDVLAGVGGFAYHVSSAGVSLVESPFAPLPTRSGFIRHGQISLAGENPPRPGGSLLQGPFTWDLSGILTSTVIPGVDGVVEAIAPAPEGPPLTLAASGPLRGDLAAEIRLHTYVDGEWSSERIESGAPRNPGRLAIVWIDGSTALVVTGGRVWRYDRGAAATPLPGLDAITALAFHPQYGLLAGDELGGVYFAPRLGADWTPVIAGDLFGVESITAYQEGFLIGKPTGRLQQYQPEGLPCETLDLVAFDLQRMIEVSDGGVVLGGKSAVAWLTPL